MNIRLWTVVVFVVTLVFGLLFGGEISSLLPDYAIAIIICFLVTGLFYAVMRVPVVLQKKVTQRTQRLTDTNNKLKQEITKREQTEVARQEGEERFRSLFQATFEGILIHDRGVILDANEAATMMMGYDLAEVVGRSVLDLVTDESKVHLKEVLSALVEEPGISSGSFELVAQRKDGSTFDIEVLGKPLNWKGQPVRVAAFRDISGRKKSDEKLHHQTMILQSILDNMGDGIVVADTNGKFVLWNPAAEKILCMGMPDIPIKEWSDHFGLYLSDKKTPYPVDELPLIRAVRGESVDAVEIFMRHDQRPDGNWLSVTTRPIAFEDGPLQGGVAVFSDITERKQSEESLQYRMAFETLITTISTNFISLDIDDIDDEINKALQKVGSFAGADRSYIFLYSDDRTSVSNMYEWCENGIDPEIHNLQNLSVEKFQWWFDQLREFNLVHIPNTEALEDEVMKKNLMDQGIKSLLAVPMSYGKSVIGFLGFDAVRRRYDWSDDIITLLKITGDICTNALERKRSEAALEYRVDAEQLINSISTSFINVPVEELDAEINATLEKVGSFADADRCYITHFLDNKVYITHEWCADGIEPIKIRETSLDQIPWLRKAFDRFEFLQVTRVADLPEDARIEREFIQSAGIKSLMAVPMVYGNELRGFMGFNAVRQEQIWPDDTITILKIVGDIFVNSFARRHARKELERMNEDLEQKVEERTREVREKQGLLLQSEKMAALGQLVAGVAHEINTPLGAMKSNNDIFIRTIEKMRNILNDESMPDEVREHRQLLRIFDSVDKLNKVNQDAAERIVSIVGSLRKFARLDQAEVDEVDLHEGMDSTITLVYHELKNRIEVRKDYGTLPLVSCHPNQINQVFMNILVNASQAIEGNGTIDIKTYTKDGTVCVEITDSGRGIDPDNLTRVFDPGFTTKGSGIGTGLGLSIVHQIIEEHHGTIEVDSEIGKGTTFRIILPVNHEHSST